MTHISNIFPISGKRMQGLSGFLFRSALVGIVCTIILACHNDDVPTPQQRDIPVSFGHMDNEGTGQITTRAGDRNLEDVLEEQGAQKDFRVWCYKTTDYEGGEYTQPQAIMDGYVVKYQQNTAHTTASNGYDWEYVGIENDKTHVPQEMKYWDINATSYRYFGFAPANANPASILCTGPNVHSDGYVWFDIDFPADAEHPELSPYISKLWFSNGNTTEFPNHLYGQKVNMEFIKPLTKVRIMVLDAKGELIKYPLEAGFSKLEFKPASGDAHIVAKGNLRVSYAITGQSTLANYLPSVLIVGDPDGTVTINKLDTHYTEWYRVLPHVTQGDYELTGIIEDKARIGKVPSIYMSWSPNMEYTYIFKLTEDDFKFIDVVQIGVTEWITESSTHDLYNW